MKNVGCYLRVGMGPVVRLPPQAAGTLVQRAKAQEFDRVHSMQHRAMRSH